ncbi:serine acetyltransferase [Methylobacterium sp. Leaf469]|uniref:serine O-acetyltransferase n=1 Tax=unclassified Methylobacterium TaxID=2615210 RepID=UPI0006F27E71|nr:MULTISPECIES: serine O-acetyltransferase [unclassified Methylobacterium]KQO70501.1 serine acetyltransferase [Methylobacterium sp. Leaf87]KQP32646.1 serine acetyltransferase [Methylobacterium sp. Leaf102]KQP33257.1 serine acetyltransferase [Methylobacterium sp. Leaf100]KQP67933.1 serine acetyltransferase [Methylobacterium sp. Leaf112]KQU02345.1 serine acetyltransferase [Methylobacterium sp. Leaf469]
MSVRSSLTRPADRETVASFDPIWTRVRAEAEALVREEPQLASFIVATLLNHSTLEAAIAHRVAARLGHQSLPAELVAHGFHEAIADDPRLGEIFRADIGAVLDRDPATTRAIEPVLYFKGFHALQAHRLAHWYWTHNRRDLALYLQSRSSEVFQTDIHPAAQIGRGVFLDHATGLVVGSTAVIDDDVSILHAVTLGGTGKQGGDRHPKIRRGVMIGAGAKILGNIEVGECARVAAGSVVLRAVPPHTTVVGVPARVVGTAGCAEPSRAMDQLLGFDAFIHIADGI